MPIPGNFLSSTTERVDPNTSGWTAKLNATLSLGTGGRNGDGCLKVTSIAAGEAQARTVASYAVLPWTEYEAFADAAGATVPERIGIRWLTAASVEISVVWSVTTSSASSAWHRIAVAAEAPATAAFAQVLVSAMTPAAAGVINYFENAYFGLPIRTTSNLLAFNTETMERDLTDWTNENNCTIARSAPPTQWSVDYYLAGGQVLAMTVTANGDAWCRTTDWPAATAGAEYVGYCYLNPPTSGSTTWVELRFHNAAGAQLQATRSILAAPGTGYYRQKVSAKAPAGTASCMLSAGITGGTAGQILRVDGAVIMPAPVFHDGSVLPYADSTFEQGIAGWVTASGVGVVSRSTPWGSQAFDGFYSGTITSATATTSVIRSAKFALPAGAAGKTFRVETIGQTTAGGWTLTRSVRWYNAANTDLGATSSSAATAPTPGWWQLGNSFTAPATATQAAVEYTLTATAINSVYRIDKISLWQDQPQAETVTDDTNARITITLRDLFTDYTISVWRVLPNGSRTLVRGANGLIMNQLIDADTLVIEDYEAPLGVDVYYVTETRDDLGAVIETRITDTVTLDPGDIQYAWLKDPGNPQRNLKVMVAKGPDWQRPISQTEFRVRGRRNSVILSDVRGGVEGDLVVYTQSDDERAALHWLLDSGNVVLWQAAPGMGVDDMYVNIAPATETRGGGIAQDPWRTWTLPLKQADMPVTVGIAGSAGRTWQDILTENATWQDVRNKYATWEDLLLNRPIGG